MHRHEESEVYREGYRGASRTLESSGDGFVAIGKGSAAVVADQEQPVRCGPGLATGAGWAEAGSKWEAKPRQRWRIFLFARVFLVVVESRRADPQWSFCFIFIFDWRGFFERKAANGKGGDADADARGCGWHAARAAVLPPT